MRSWVMPVILKLNVPQPRIVKTSVLQTQNRYFVTQKHLRSREMANHNRFVDTHCNLPNILQKSNTEVTPEKFLEFKQKNFGDLFEKCVSVASDAASQEATAHLMSNVDCINGAFGIHPLYGGVCYHHRSYCEVEYTPEVEKRIIDLMSNPKTVAWGEIGLDYHQFKDHDYAPPDLQKSIFVTQMKHAIRLNKPIVIHTREAEQDTLQMMKEHIPRDWKLHVHCFTDSLPFAQELISYFENLFIGFTGVITFKTSTALQKVAKEIPLERLLLETDGPFMAPVPFRGSVCHPGHIPQIAQKIADLKQVSVDTVYQHTRENTTRMYGI